MRKLLQLVRLGGLLSVLLACAPSAWATFPAFASACSKSTNGGTNNTVDVVNLPASVAAGDLILEFHFKDGSGTHSYPSPWVEIKDAILPSSAATVGIAYLIASGGETSVTVTTTHSERFAALACRIAAAAWHGTTPPEISTGASNTSSNPDPDSVTASWGSDDNLFIAVEASDQNSVVSTYPSTYPDNQTASDPTFSSGRGAIATRELAASSDDPGTFGLSANDQWWAGTIVVRPAAGGGGGPAPPRLPLLGVGP